MDIKQVLSYIYNSKTPQEQITKSDVSDEINKLKAQLAEAQKANEELQTKLQAKEDITTRLSTPPAPLTPVAVPVPPTPVIDPELLKVKPEELIDGVYNKVINDMKMFKSPKNLTDIEAFVYVAKTNGIPSAKIAEDIAKGNFDYS